MPGFYTFVPGAISCLPLHGGGGNLSFADGHAEIHKWKDAVTKAKVVKGQCPAYGNTSPNDYRWLQQHATALN